MYILRIYRPESGYSSVFLCKNESGLPESKNVSVRKTNKIQAKLYLTIEFSKPKNPQRTCLRLGVQTVNFTREQMTRMMLYR